MELQSFWQEVAIMIDFAVGAVLGAFISYLFYRSLRAATVERLTTAEEELQDKSQRLENLDYDLQSAWDAKARAEQDSERLPELEQQVAELRRENSELKEQVTELRKGRESDEEKVRWLDQAQGHMREAFQSIASQMLQSYAEEFLNLTRDKVEDILNQGRRDWITQRREIQKLVEPLEGTLETLGSQVHELERNREGAFQELQEQLGQLGKNYPQLQSTTATLVKAFKLPGDRGVWKEVQLRRVVEMAGIMEHVDFNGQAADAAQPNMIVHLPNKGILPVDAKTPMQAYLEAMEASDEELRKEKIEVHSRELRQRILELGERSYMMQFERTPELVAMLMPNDACLGVAFERDPELLEFAIQQRVLLTTPLTLLALLKAVAYGWQQHQVLENARQIAVQGEQLYNRLSSFLNRMNGLGRRLDQAVQDYNKTVGSLQGQVFPFTRRLREMDVTSTKPPSAAAVKSQTGPPDSPDLDEQEENTGSGSDS